MFCATKLVGNALLAVLLGAIIHDAVLEATMYPTICSCHASGGVIAEGVV
jgi:hypothetical protein